jgi:hypothetical protein
MEKKLECHCSTPEQVNLLNVISDFGNFISSAFFLLLALHVQRGVGPQCGRARRELARRGQGWRGRAQRGQWSCMAWACTRWDYKASASAFISLCFWTLYHFEEFSNLFIVMENGSTTCLKLLTLKRC